MREEACYRDTLHFKPLYDKAMIVDVAKGAAEVGHEDKVEDDEGGDGDEVHHGPDRQGYRPLPWRDISCLRVKI